MLVESGYNRKAVRDYAKKWAYGRNPRFYNFDEVGGDCTNFASQCIFAGSGVMNYTKVLGWYYNSAFNRAVAWTGVDFLYKFLISNKREGPYGILTDIGNIEIGDLAQLGNEGGQFYHSPIVCGFENGEILLAAHSRDVYNYPLSSYIYDKIRFIHIEGVRKWK